jgi:hypothetical protein
MNNNRRKIIAYIDGNMNPDEKLLFEKELENNENLRKEVREVKLFLAGTKKDGEPPVNESYFINILPEFNSRQLSKRKFHIPVMAYSVTGIAAVIVILFFIFNPLRTSENLDTKELSVNLTEQEMNETLNQYEDPYSNNEIMNSATSVTDSIVNSMVKNELDLSSGSIDKTITERYITTEDLLGSLNENEANELYSQLINEDIINGARQ